jgi:HEAT repeat protein
MAGWSTLADTTNRTDTKESVSEGRSNVVQGLRMLIARSMTDRGTNTVVEPRQLPKLDHTPIPSDNGPPDEPDIVGFWNVNSGTLNALKGDPLRREKLETLMDRESRFALKLLLASEAAPLGSPKAALFILDSMTNTDYRAAQNTFTAIRFIFSAYKENTPDWLVKMAEAALSDDRNVTGLQEVGWSRDTSFTMSYVADEDANLTLALGWSRCTNAVSFLIEMAKKTNGRRGPIMALGNLGDRRAIPILIEFVKEKGPLVPNKLPLDDALLRPVVGLGQLHAKESIPLLLQYLEHPDVIEVLQTIGDPSAIDPLQKLIVAKGRVEEPGASNDPGLQQNRLATARIAVASLDPGDRTEKLCQLLTDSSFDQYQRRSVVWALASHPDSRAIPFLAKAINTDESGAVVNQTIVVLAEFKYKAVVDVLVDALDVDFQGKQDWKRAYKPEMFRDNIARSLNQLTGQTIPADKQQWSIWWKSHRDSVPGLQ